MTTLLETPPAVVTTPPAKPRGGTAGKILGYALLIALSLLVMIRSPGWSRRR